MRQILFLLVLVLISCEGGKKYHNKSVLKPASEAVRSIIAFQNKLNEEYKDPETSPLPDRYRKNFEGLDFFKPNEAYIVKARFERTADAKPFLLPNTGGDNTTEVVYGIAHFELNGKQHRLEIYQSPELIKQEKYRDYLFLPFLDETNGEETYGGGRYIDLSIPNSDTLIIDFNKAYNPYCVYNKKYSCPLVPRQNYLNTKVLAGVRDFIKK